jgi:hypothetical protein
MNELRQIQEWQKPFLFELDVLKTQTSCDASKIASGTDGFFDTNGTTPCNAYS